MDQEIIYKHIKGAFCNLIDFKARGQSIEIITPFSTINNKFISIFITQREGKYIISDGGWVDQDVYGEVKDIDSEDILLRIQDEFISSYRVKTTVNNTGHLVFFKSTDDMKELASFAFDLATFLSAIINSRCIKFTNEKEIKEREKFRSEANSFLKNMYGDSVLFRKHLDDIKNIRFSAIIQKSSSIYIVNYVTGSSSVYFANELRKCIVNFEIASTSIMNNYIAEKIALVNNEAKGFEPEKSGPILNLLRERSTKNYISWTERTELFKIIQPN
jgi:hypothetical protein